MIGYSGAAAAAAAAYDVLVSELAMKWAYDYRHVARSVAHLISIVFLRNCWCFVVLKGDEVAWLETRI